MEEYLIWVFIPGGGLTYTFKNSSKFSLTSVISLSDCIELLLTCRVPQHQPHVLIVYSETSVKQISETEGACGQLGWAI